MYKFTTEVDLLVTGCHKQQGFGGVTDIVWTLEFESNDDGDGIGSFVVKVPNQVIKSNAWVYDEETDEETQELVEITIQRAVVNLGNARIADGMKPITLDIYKNIATLRFR